MILADTSAWVEFLRDTGSPACSRLAGLLGSGLVTTDAVQMEVLAGARDDAHVRALRRLLLRAHMLATLPGKDFHLAANLYRSCRSAGSTPRSIVDCLVAAVAIRNEVPVLHRDRDFAAISSVSSLRIDQGG